MSKRSQPEVLEGDQVFPDDILIEIFTRTDSKTATRCRALGKAWNQLLQEDTFLKENTLKNDGMHSNLLLQIGRAPWISSTDCLCTLDPSRCRLGARTLPIQFGRNGWWNFIGSQYGVLCIRYSIDGFIPAIKVWNPLLKKVRDIEDLAQHLYCQAVSGYAFGYTTKTNKYHVVRVSKRHSKDKFIHCNVFNSADGEWKHGYATDVVVFNLERFEIKKIRIVRAQCQHFQNRLLYEGNIYLVGYELNINGIVTIMSKVDITGMSILP
ncbi:hypothetical protein PIB30_011402 [Stylosanthes scabra]|uniref:F-box associated beta-propeller type 1 domain-containing protein n=1 Tax=Stylosanthes scabra TaxID=79078 RepID=A0ABU6Z3E5_9FABA|nr:hypothetical protein [Stylosanthes scabra]